jgi:hypothetical protein
MTNVAKFRPDFVKKTASEPRFCPCGNDLNAKSLDIGYRLNTYCSGACLVKYQETPPAQPDSP